MLGTPVHVWVVFGVAIVVAIAVDLGVFHRKAHRIGLKEALAESAAWIVVALLFNLWVYHARGHQAGLEFLTGYLVEKSLSVDNIFVFLLIFQSLAVPAQAQHKVLYYGVVGALVMRAAFVFAGVALLRSFHVVLFVFGAILFLTAVRMLLPSAYMVKPERNWLVRLVRMAVPVTTQYEGESFWVRRRGKWNATPLLLALVAVEATDILFAVDSVPAVLAITRDSFIAYSSNVFAILGLRALYFGLADVLPRFRFLRSGLAAILLFTSAKMVASDWLPMSTGLSLGVILGIVAVMVAASAVWPGKETATH
ncbi:MAG TPA: TerC family protein [Candidatus Acidoferrales bacterium]|nr:TerC family protein [Candidatus Acidoferrales bacterium]